MSLDDELDAALQRQDEVEAVLLRKIASDRVLGSMIDSVLDEVRELGKHFLEAGKEVGIPLLKAAAKLALEAALERAEKRSR